LGNPRNYQLGKNEKRGLRRVSESKSQADKIRG